MNRKHWKFSYPASKLLEAVMAKMEFHKKRLDWWSDERATTQKTLQAAGIKIEESVAGTNYSSGRGPQVTLDNELVSDFNECVAKVEEHRSKIDDYHAWSQILGSQGDATFDLDHEDWMFFFAANNTVIDEVGLSKW